MTDCIQCFVSGHVQGVFYRASTQAMASKLGITGYARNLPDRRVEVLACGDSEALEALRDWLWKGPEYAEVSDVECSRISVEQIPPAFTTG